MVSWLPSPMLARAKQTSEWGSLRSPGNVLERPPQHDVYYQRFAMLKSHLGHEDVVVTPATRAVFDLAAVTGASVIASPNAHRVPDRHERTRAVAAFFHSSTKVDERQAIARRWRATHVLVPSSHFGLLPELARAFSEPLYRDEQFALLSVRR
jgi:hypothetical protein